MPPAHATGLPTAALRAYRRKEASKVSDSGELSSELNVDPSE